MEGSRPSIGITGRILAILPAAMAIEFVASTWLYEEARQETVRDDEAHRLAEHLIVARRLIGAAPIAERASVARQLSTENYDIGWQAAAPERRDDAASATRTQILDWEPSLTGNDLDLAVSGADRRAVADGALKLKDGSYVTFHALVPLQPIEWLGKRILIALLLAALAAVLGVLAVRRALAPLRRLADAADRFGDPDAPLPSAADGASEVRHLFAAFQRLHTRIARLIADRTQALAAVGHDLRTPLARLRLRADTIDDDETRDALADDVGEMEEMVESLLAFLGREATPEQPVLTDIAALCETIADDAADRGLAVSYDGPDHADWLVRKAKLKRAIANLVDNAVHYGSSAVIRLASGENGFVVAVEDDGPGIPEDDLARVIDPFVRLDQARQRNTKGFGLGLAIVAGIVADEGGTLALSNRPTGGLRAEIRLGAARHTS